MKKIYAILCLIGGIFLTGIQTTNAQCNVDTSVGNAFYLFSTPDGVAFTGSLCSDIDSVVTYDANGYYDGDGYILTLLAGTHVTFRVDSCTGTPVALTLVDSTNTIISGAYSAPACPNSLSYVVTVTGTYAIVMSANGTCSGGGTTLIGEVYASIDTGSTAPACPIQANVVNDTICGATQIMIDGGAVAGNSSLAYPTDPLDQTILDMGYICSVDLNNTLWYTFTCPQGDSALYIRSTVAVGGGFESEIAVLQATDVTNPCDVNSLVYIDCASGADDVLGVNDVSIRFPGPFNPGDVFYLLVDGFSGTTGEFTLEVLSSQLFNSIDKNDASKSFSVYPNPANSSFVIENKNMTGKVNVELTNSIGQVVLSRTFENFSKETLDVNNQPAGIYSVKVTSDNKSFDKKLVITK